MVWGLSAVLAAALVVGCVSSRGDEAEDAGEDEGDDEDEDGEGGEEGGGVSVTDETCASGLRWASGDAESPRMHPGMDCLGCHQERGEAEEYTIGGTVYGALTEPDDCFGLADVSVEITGADGAVLRMTTTESGNFTHEHASVALPYTAKVLLDGRELAMTTPQSILSCNVCHAQTGVNMAPGRILAP